MAIGRGEPVTLESQYWNPCNDVLKKMFENVKRKTKLTWVTLEFNTPSFHPNIRGKPDGHVSVKHRVNVPG